MATWENIVVNNPLWLDTSNPDLYALKKYDSAQSKWVSSTVTKADDLDTYDKPTVDSKIADNVQRNKNVWLDVIKDFGAKGDGITDDTVAIQNAFNYARDHGSVRLYFPEGTYCISNYIQVYKNTTVEYHPNAVVKRIGMYYKMFVNGDLSNKSYVTGGVYTGEGNIHFYGGTFDMNYSNLAPVTTGSITSGSKILTVPNGSLFISTMSIVVTGAGLSGADLSTGIASISGNAITLDDPASTTVTNATVKGAQTMSFFDLIHAENISFNKITVKNGQIGHYFQLSSVKNVKIKDCWFGGITYTGDGINFSYECIQIEVATSDSNPDFGIYDLTISRDIYIEDCTFDGVIRAIGTHSDGKYGTSNVIFCENIQAQNNVIKNVTDIGINFTSYRYSVVENNIIDTTSGYGINMNVSEDNLFSGNKILNTQKAGLNMVSSHNNKFTKNTMKEVALTSASPYAGTRLSASNGNTFDDNTITAVTPNYTYAWYSSDGGVGNKIISHNYTKGKTAVIGGSDDTEKANIQFGNGQTVLFDGDISTVTTPVTLPHDIRNFNYLVIMSNNNSGSASMQSMVLPKAAISFGSTTSRFRLETADGTGSSNQIDFSFPTSTSIQADVIQGTGHIRKVIGML